MKKLELHFRPYELKFSKPFETSRGKVTHRKGIIIYIKNENNITASGDVCPFPEFGSESYESVENTIKNFNHNIQLDVENFELSFQKNFADLEKYPSLRCGVEQAILTLISAEKNISINQVLNAPSRPNIKINAVIPFNSPSISASVAEQFVDEGFSTLKIKLGSNNFSTDLKCVKEISSAVGGNINLRVDINGKWNFEDAVNNIRELEEYNIEYVEQPVNTIQDFSKLSRLTRLPLAVDESVRNLKDAVAFIRSGSVKYLILKPMMIGGITPLLSIYEVAKENDAAVVVTSSFESGIGFAYVVFAASLIQEDIAHGLATQDYFETKMLPQTYSVKNGVINL